MEELNDQCLTRTDGCPLTQESAVNALTHRLEQKKPPPNPKKKQEEEKKEEDTLASFDQKKVPRIAISSLID